MVMLNAAYALVDLKVLILKLLLGQGNMITNTFESSLQLYLHLQYSLFHIVKESVT